MTLKKLIGSDVNQVPTNGMLGTMAFQDANYVTVTSCVFAAGSDASPSISFTSDPDTGLYSPGANQVALSSNGAECLRIDSSGRLLVGVSSDSGGALFQVNGNRIRVATAKTPASASDTGTTGEICWDASYIYVCTATNTWKRAALSTW